MLRIILAIVSVLLILISLLQGGKSDGLSAFTGASDLGLFANAKDTAICLNTLSNFAHCEKKVRALTAITAIIKITGNITANSTAACQD